MNPESGLLEGSISVIAALEAASRPIHRVWLRGGPLEADMLRVQRLAETRGVPVERADAAQLETLAAGRSHGGVLAEVGDRQYAALETLCEGVEAPFIVMLDGVEDPFNFGQATRALYAAGATGLVVRPRSWMSAAGTVARASAGASERLLTAVAETAEAAADAYRQAGLRIAVTDHRRATSLYDTDLTGPLFLLIGGERRGVTRSFSDAADVRLKVPYGRSFPMSLGASPACAVIAFEVMRQRMALAAAKK